jgi:periplasmic protein TonB
MKLIFLGVFLFWINLVFSQNTNSIRSSEADTLVANKVDLEACVDEKEWVVHLTNELEPAIKKAAKKGLRAGTYTVRIKFLVERDGSINYVQA